MVRDARRTDLKLQHVLSRSCDVEIDLDRYRADELKKAARFWVGEEATKFRKEKSIQALANLRDVAVRE